MNRTQLTTSADLTREEVDFLIEEAENLRGKNTDDLKGKVVASLFYEPSTRTRLSFETAAHRLGASVITVSGAGSTSMKKGETLEDTISVIEKYADVLVMRHPEEGAADRAVAITKKPFLNAGDGANQHPTQALLDMYTIHREMGGIDGITIAFIGDLKYGRTVHSILYVLRHYKVKKVILISPEALKTPQEYLDMMDEAGIEYVEDENMEKFIPEMDILYMTRIQQERFASEEEYLKYKGVYVLTADKVKQGKDSMRILHPLPRVDEITTDVDPLPQAHFFQEVENGVYMRMALLKNLTKNFYS